MSFSSHHLSVPHVTLLTNQSKCLSSYHSVPFLCRRNSNNLTKPSFSTQTFLQTSSVLKPFCKLNMNKRSVLLGLTLLTTTFFTTTNQSLLASIVQGNSCSDKVLDEFGSKPRQLNCVIRVLVPRPKSEYSEEETVEVLRVIDIDIPNTRSARFDVYVAKPDEKQELEGYSDLGEYAGSLIELDQRRFKKRTMSLGITNLVRRIGGENCEKLIVSLVPRDGELSIGGVRIDQIQAQ